MKFYPKSKMQMQSFLFMCLFRVLVSGVARHMTFLENISGASAKQLISTKDEGNLQSHVIHMISKVSREDIVWQGGEGVIFNYVFII